MAVSRQLEAYLEYNKLVEEDFPQSNDQETRKLGGVGSGHLSKEGHSSTGHDEPRSDRIGQESMSEMPVRASRSL